MTLLSLVTLFHCSTKLLQILKLILFLNTMQSIKPVVQAKVIASEEEQLE